MKKYLIVLGLVLALAVMPVVAGAQTLADLQALIAQLQAQIAALTSQLTQIQGGTSNSNSSGQSGGGVSGSINNSAGNICVIINRPLYRGISDSLNGGGEVSKLQRFLKSQGMYNDEISGFYGVATEASVRRFQANNGVVSSGDGASTGYGLVGTLTRERIRKISCGVSGSVNIDNSRSPSITVTSPNGGEIIALGIKDVDFRTEWSSINLTGNVDVYLNFTDGGACLIKRDVPVSQGYITATLGSNYQCPSTTRYITSGQYKVLLDIPNTKLNDKSDNYFTITTGPVVTASITVTSPNGGESWGKLTKQNITWKTTLTDATIDISLVPYYPPCSTSPCPAYPYRSPYIISNGALNNSSYNWPVGQIINNNGSVEMAPDGTYYIQVCKASDIGTTICDKSDTPFTIGGEVSLNRPPVITGLTAPTTVIAGQMGTWAVKAYDPEGGALNYTINWGEPQLLTAKSGSTGQEATFTHSYSTPGTYKVVITVSDGAGQTAQTSAPVQVNMDNPSLPLKPIITVISPNGGEVFTSSSTANIKFKIDNLNTTANIILQLYRETATGFTYVRDITTYGYDGPISYPWLIPADVTTGKYFIYAAITALGGIPTDSKGSMDMSDNSFTINSFTPTLKATLNVTVLNGGIQCFTTPCEFPLSGAQVSIYDANKVLIGNRVVGSNGLATFINLNPGTYTIYALAAGYNKSAGSTIGLVSGQAGSLKISVYPSTSKLPLSSATDSQLAAVLQSLQTSLNLLKGAIGY